jgi:ADP-heptose:LPS heptosyltransferase
MHAVDEFLNVVGSIGVTADDTRLVLSAPADAEAEVRRYLEAGGVRDDELLVGIHPGGHYWTQRWPPERFARLSDAITEEYKAKAVLITGPGEGPLAGEVLSKMSRPPLVFSGRPTGHLIALIWRCDLLICNNSGPLHIAAALGTPTVSMMGPTIPERWWPRGEGHIVIRKDLPCMPCNEGRCPIGTHDCMRLITVQDVIDAVESQLSRRPKVAKHA